MNLIARLTVTVLLDTVDRVTVTATATDALGRTATASRTLTVSLAPC